MFYAYKGNEIGGVSPIYYDVPTETIELTSFVRSGRTLTRTLHNTYLNHVENTATETRQ